MNREQRIATLRAEITRLEAMPIPRNGDIVRFDMDGMTRVVIVSKYGNRAAYSYRGALVAENAGVDRLYEDGYTVLGNVFDHNSEGAR